jgi:DNA-binding CsgD family transcriptional regulator
LRFVEPEDVFAGAVHNVFSRKQRNVLKWIYHGKTNWEIAKILDMNEETVKYHVEQAMMKLDVKTRAQAVGRAIEIGLISPDRPT